MRTERTYHIETGYYFIMKLLMHACCAPCAVKCVGTLRKEGIEPSILWANPNIHPYTEYESRRSCLKDFCLREQLDLFEEGSYGLRTFLEGVSRTEPRCRYCYDVRLDTTARYAAEHGFDAFTTTLLISPYQKHYLIAAIGEEKAAKYGLQFLYRDFRPFFREGQALARASGFYMQKYCGCIFSEEERYLGTKKTNNGFPK